MVGLVAARLMMAFHLKNIVSITGLLSDGAIEALQSMPLEKLVVRYEFLLNAMLLSLDIVLTPITTTGDKYDLPERKDRRR